MKLASRVNILEYLSFGLALLGLIFFQSVNIDFSYDELGILAIIDHSWSLLIVDDLDPVHPSPFIWLVKIWNDFGESTGILSQPYLKALPGLFAIVNWLVLSLKLKERKEFYLFQLLLLTNTTFFCFAQILRPYSAFSLFFSLWVIEHYRSKSTTFKEVLWFICGVGCHFLMLPFCFTILIVNIVLNNKGLKKLYRYAYTLPVILFSTYGIFFHLKGLRSEHISTFDLEEVTLFFSNIISPVYELPPVAATIFTLGIVAITLFFLLQRNYKVAIFLLMISFFSFVRAFLSSGVIDGRYIVPLVTMLLFFLVKEKYKYKKIVIAFFIYFQVFAIVKGDYFNFPFDISFSKAIKVAISKEVKISKFVFCSSSDFFLPNIYTFYPKLLVKDAQVSTKNCSKEPSWIEGENYFLISIYDSPLWSLSSVDPIFSAKKLRVFLIK